MSKISVISKCKVILFAVITLVSAIILTSLDVVFLQQNPIIVLNNYNAIIVTLWAIQATMSTLTIAFVSIFTNRLQEKHYGLSVKELLSMNIGLFGLNFYEKIICVLALTIISMIPVLFNCLNTSTIIAILEFIMIFEIVIISLKVTVEENYASSIAQKHVDKLLITVENEDNQIDDQDELQIHRLTPAQQELLNIVRKITDELFTESERTDFSLRSDNKSLSFLMKIERKCRKDKPNMYKSCNEELKHLFDKLMVDKRHKSAMNLAKWMLWDRDTKEAHHIAGVICYEYYNRKLDREYFETFIKQIKDETTQKLNEYLELSLEIMFQILQNADEHYYKILLGSSLQYSDIYRSHVKADFMHITSAYLYYLCLKEPLYIEQFGETNATSLKNLVLASININGKKTSLANCICDKNNIYGIKRCLELIKQRHGKFFYRDLYVLGQVRAVHIDEDIEEYASMILFVAYSGDKKILDSLEYSFLCSLRKKLTDGGYLIENCKKIYEKFTDWIDVEKREKNLALLNDLNIVIKKMAIDRAIVNRKDVDTINEKIDTLRLDITKLLEKSPFYSKSFSDSKLSSCYIPYIEDVESYSKHVAYLGMDTAIFAVMQQNLFWKNFSNLKRYDIHTDIYEHEEKVKKLLEFIAQKKSSTNFNQVFNERISDYFAYHNIDNELYKRMVTVDDNINLSEFRWDIGKYVMLYLNDDIFKPTIIINDNFITATMYLTDEEVENYIHDYCSENDTFYILLNDEIKLSCTHQECSNYIKETKFKLKFDFEINISEKEFGAAVFINPSNNN